MSNPTFQAWLTERKLPSETIAALMLLAGKSDFFESAERIMDPDVWFHYPGNTRFVLIGSRPNGDAVALDTSVEPGVVYFINHETVHDAVTDECTVKVANSLPGYLQACGDDPDFPFDYHDAKARA